MAQEVMGSGPVTVTDESKHVSLSLSLEAGPSLLRQGRWGWCWSLTKKAESGVWPAPLNWSSLGGPTTLSSAALCPSLMGRCHQTSQLFLIR